MKEEGQINRVEPRDCRSKKRGISKERQTQDKGTATGKKPDRASRELYGGIRTRMGKKKRHLDQGRLSERVKKKIKINK